MLSESHLMLVLSAAGIRPKQFIGRPCLFTAPSLKSCHPSVPISAIPCSRVAAFDSERLQVIQFVWIAATKEVAPSDFGPLLNRLPFEVRGAADADDVKRWFQSENIGNCHPVLNCDC